MPLRLALALDAPGARPGAAIGATVQVREVGAAAGAAAPDRTMRRPLPPQATNGGPLPLTVTAALLDLTCVETVDPARLAPAFAAGRPKPARPPGGGRGDARHLLAPAPVPLLGGAGEAVELAPGESRTWRAVARLPLDAPPTLAGAAVRVAYKLTASASYTEGGAGGEGERASSATVVTPLTVWPPRPSRLPPPGCLATGDAATVALVRYEPGQPLAGGARLAVVAARGGRAPPPPPPGLGLGRRLSSSADGGGGSGGAPAPAADGDAPSPAEPPQPPPPSFGRRVFALRGTHGEIARLTLAGPPDGQLAPGATLRGALDLRSAQPPAPACVRFAASLDCVERVADAWAVGDGLARRTVADEEGCETAHLSTTSFSLTLPPHAPPTLVTPLVSIGWVLRLEIGASAPGGEGGDASAAALPPPPLLEWELPLLVHASDADDDDG
jgi:hypothetical protein